MCGIAGRVGDGAPDEARLRAVAATLEHRGPDSEGVWAGEGVGLAFRRLAILDLDGRADQPMHLGPLHLVFNGEIYNYRELRADLQSRGHRFATTGDTEVLLHAWQQWGEGALERLDGMFALAVWDDTDGSLTLAVDAFGEKPLLWARQGDAFGFASDARSLRAALDLPLAAHDAAVRDFVALGVMPPTSETFFAGVHRLAPASVARLQDGRLSLRRWWSPRHVEVPADPVAAAALVRETLAESVTRRLRADVPVGTSLSGGVDSSAVLLLAAQGAGGVVQHAFTARFPGYERDEWAYAAASAQSAGVVEHHAVEPTAQTLLEDVDALAADQEEPFGSLSIYAQWCVYRAAREAGVTVLLDGQGADELFGGYHGSPGLALRSAGLRAALPVLRQTPALRVEWARSLLAGRLPRPLERRYRHGLVSPYLEAGPAAAAAEWRPEPVDFGTLRPSPVRRELVQQTLATSLPQLLRYADRDSMAHSREVRLPFTRRRLAEVAWSLPPELVAREGVAKRVLRDAVADLVPAVVLDRRDKVGFEPPQARWMADPAVRTLVGDLLLRPGAATADLLDRARIERERREGAWSDHGALWRAVSVELWTDRVCGPPS